MARAALDAGATLARRRARSRRASSCGDAGIDAPVLVLSEPPPDAAAGGRARGPDAHRVHARRDRRARQGRRRRRPRRPPAGPPQGRHRHAPRRVLADDALALRRRRSPQPRRARARRRVHAPRGRRRARPPVHRRAARSASTRCSPTSTPRPAPPSVHAANSAGLLAHRGRATTSCVPASPLYGVAPGAEPRGSRRRCDPALSLRAPVSHVKRSPPASRAVVRPALRARPRRDRSRRCRSATPTACPATSASPAARCSSAAGGARSPGTVTMDQLMVDVRRRRRRGRRRGRAHRPQGDDEITADGVGRAARHDRATRSCPASARASRGGTCERSGRVRWQGAGIAASGVAAVSPVPRTAHEHSGGRAAVRRRPDPDAGRLGPRSTRSGASRATTAGASTRSAAGDGPGDRALARRHHRTRVWVKQFDDAPGAGLPRGRVRPPRPRRLGRRLARPLARRTSLTTSARCSRRSISATSSSSATRWAASPRRRSPSTTRSRPRAGPGARAPVDARRTPHQRALGARCASSGSPRAGSTSAAHVQRPQLRLVLARIGFGRDPPASHVELTRHMLAECDPDTAATRSSRCSVSTSPTSSPHHPAHARRRRAAPTSSRRRRSRGASPS